MDAIPFPQLQSFLAVARAKSFSGDAREPGVSRAAVSQGVRHLEESLGVVLLARTTRSVSLTDAGQQLLELAGPAFAQTRAALDEVAAKPGEVVGRVRLTVPRSAFSFVIEPVPPTFRERHPRIQLEFVFEDRRVDIVGEGYDAGVRLSEFVERDMVSVRLTDPFRFVVGAPSYLKKHGAPQRPEDLLHHECLTFRSDTTGSLFAWELERGRRTWRIPVRGSIVTNDGLFCIRWAEQGARSLLRVRAPSRRAAPHRPAPLRARALRGLRLRLLSCITRAARSVRSRSVCSSRPSASTPHCTRSRRSVELAVSRSPARFLPQSPSLCTDPPRPRSSSPSRIPCNPAIDQGAVADRTAVARRSGSL